MIKNVNLKWKLRSFCKSMITQYLMFEKSRSDDLNH